jgi:hypothetical protein
MPANTSGGRPDGPAVRPVPPGSTPLRELCHAIDQALALPAPATQRYEVTYLRILRDRARLVRQAIRGILADREGDDRDLMLAVSHLRDQVAQLGDDAYDHAPGPS